MIRRQVRTAFERARESSAHDAGLALLERLEQWGDATEFDEKWKRDVQALDSEVEAANRFIGRRKEFRALTEWIQSADERHAAILGTAGIGKTRMVERAARWAALKGHRVLSAAIPELCSRVPYAALASALSDGIRARDLSGLTDHALAALSDIVPGLIPPRTIVPKQLDPDAAQIRTFEAIAQLLLEVSEGKQLLLVLDDFQWVDSTSCQAIQYVRARLLRNRPLKLLVAARHEELKLNSAARALVDDEKLAGLQFVLPPMSVEELEKLLEPEKLSSDGVRRIAERSGGNPFFALQLAAFHEDLPGTIASAIRRRIALAPADEIAVAEVLAVAGGAIDKEMLPRLHPQAATVLAGEAPRLFHRQGDELALEHQLLRDTLYYDISEPRRLAQHLNIGSEYLRLGDAPLAIEHLILGEDYTRAVSIAERALSSSSQQHSPDTRLYYLRVVAEYGGPGARSVARTDLLALLLQLGRSAEAVAVGSALPATRSNSEHLLARYADLFHRSNLPVTGESAIEEVRQLFCDAVDADLGPVVPEVGGLLLRVAHERHDTQTIGWAVRALRRFAHQSNDPATQARALRRAALYTAYYRGVTQSLRADLATAKRLASANESGSLIALIDSAWGVILFFRGYIRKAYDVILGAQQQAEAQGALLLSLQLQTALSAVEIDLDLLEVARLRAATALEEARSLGARYETALAAVNGAIASWELREIDAAEYYAHEAISTSGDRPIWFVSAGAWAILGQAAIEKGQVREAVLAKQHIDRIMPRDGPLVEDLSGVFRFINRLAKTTGTPALPDARLRGLARHYRKRHFLCHAQLYLELQRNRAARGETVDQRGLASLQTAALRRGAVLFVRQLDESGLLSAGG